jgi:hypothetical protein
MKKTFFFIVALLFSVSAQESEATADSTEATKEAINSFQLIGHASYQGGQVLSGTYKLPNDIGHYWNQRVFGNIGFIKKVDERLSVQVGFEIGMFPSYLQGSTFPETQRASPQPYIDQARSDLNIFNSEEMKHSLTIGYFYFQYNKEVRNLGNNLYKSYCYPAVIVQPEFDFPFTRVCGLDLHSSFLNGKLQNDLLLTTELQLYPAGDFSITDVVGYKPISCLNIGAGIQFNRLLSVKDILTSPKNSLYVSPASPTDTTFFTFAGTKLMALINFDPKKLIFADSDPWLFGEEDLKVYGEINVLGMKNYDYFYDTLSQRTPISLGINLPAFKFLDVIALEGEYFPTRFPNSIERPVNSNLPEPDYKNIMYRSADSWKWSVYAKKTISHFSIVGQVARDHLQLWSLREVDRQYHDNLIQKKDFYYVFKFQYNL